MTRWCLLQGFRTSDTLSASIRSFCQRQVPEESQRPTDVTDLAKQLERIISNLGGRARFIKLLVSLSFANNLHLLEKLCDKPPDATPESLQRAADEAEVRIRGALLEDTLLESDLPLAVDLLKDPEVEKTVSTLRTVFKFRETPLTVVEYRRSKVELAWRISCAIRLWSVLAANSRNLGLNTVIGKRPTIPQVDGSRVQLAEVVQPEEASVLGQILHLKDHQSRLVDNCHEYIPLRTWFVDMGFIGSTQSSTRFTNTWTLSRSSSRCLRCLTR